MRYFNALTAERTNKLNAIKQLGPEEMFTDQMAVFKVEDVRLAKEHRDLETLKSRKSALPKSLNDRRTLFEQELKGLALDSHETVPLLNRLVP